MSAPKLPTWVEEVKALYDGGASDVEVMRHLKWNEKQLRDNYENNEGFRSLIDYGRLSSKAWWVRQARENLQNRTFNTALYVAYMKNNFGWAEKQENVDSTPIENMSQDELKKNIEAALPKIAKYFKGEGMSDATLLTLVGKKK